MENDYKKLITAYAEYKKGVLDPKDLSLKENLELQVEYYTNRELINDPGLLEFVKKVIVAQENIGRDN